MYRRPVARARRAVLGLREWGRRR